MKIAGVLAGLAVAAAAVYFVFIRKPLPASTSNNSSGYGAAGSTDPGAIPKPNQPLESPRSREEETRQEFSRKRLPFYKFLRDNFADVIQRFAVTESIDTLDVQVAKDDDKILHRIISEAVGPGAKEYGFRKVRFYVANAKTAVQPVTLIAESALDESGQWNTFKK